MTELAWPAVRNDTIRKFNGQPPRPNDEQTVIDVFTTLPSLVLNAIDEIAEAQQAGKIRYGWSVLAKRLATANQPLSDITVDTSTTKTKKTRAAENWIRNAGLYFDLERDIDDELFNPRTGTLRDHADDQLLRERLLALWREQRPRGEHAEHEHEAYMTRIRDQRRDPEQKAKHHQEQEQPAA